MVLRQRAWLDVVRVQAFAILAVGFFYFETATVATVIITSRIIVLVVTVAIALVLRRPTFWLVVRVLAFALLAVLFLHRAATVAAVIIATITIVIVVTVAIALVLRRP